MTKKFVCTVCGYVHEGNEAPEKCPKCGVPASKFKEVPSLRGTKTEKNLQEAFAGESMARNKYTYFASKAKKDGFVQMAAIFEETANNEKEHAKLWYKYLNGGEVSGTEANLEDAASGEICPIAGPLEAPENLPSVRRAMEAPNSGSEAMASVV